MAKTMEMFVDEKDVGTAICKVRAVIDPSRFHTIRVGWCGWKDWIEAWYIRVKVTESERLDISKWYINELPFE